MNILVAALSKADITQNRFSWILQAMDISHELGRLSVENATSEFCILFQIFPIIIGILCYAKLLDQDTILHTAFLASNRNKNQGLLENQVLAQTN